MLYLLRLPNAWKHLSDRGLLGATCRKSEWNSESAHRRPAAADGRGAKRVAITGRGSKL